VVSLALIVQALLFGDGGITAIGANCFNMAVICPLVGWGIYRLIAGSAPVQSARQWIGGAVGGWLGLTVAAVVAGVELGIQPLIAHDAAGHALYCPFGLAVAVPAMGLGHLLLLGPLEGLVTALVVAYFQRTAPELLATQGAGKPLGLAPRLALIVGLLVLLTPLGLWLPARLHAGPAWGEWSGAEVQTRIAAQQGGPGYVPSGLAHAEARGWKAPLLAYALPGQEQAPLSKQSGGYILSAAVGVIVLGFLIILLQRVLARKEEKDGASAVDAGAKPAGR
jgi:cobalt/nickel transport system permease protein